MLKLDCAKHLNFCLHKLVSSFEQALSLQQNRLMYGYTSFPEWDFRRYWLEREGKLGIPHMGDHSKCIMWCNKCQIKNGLKVLGAREVESSSPTAQGRGSARSAPCSTLEVRDRNSVWKLPRSSFGITWDPKVGSSYNRLSPRGIQPGLYHGIESPKYTCSAVMDGAIN